MFVTLVGVTFLFGMASANGTLDLFSKKVVALVGKRTYLNPILMFVLSAFISAIGPGHIAAGILMTTFAVYLAFELKINPMATALYAKLGANAGCASVLSLTGILVKNLSEPLGYHGFGTHLFLSTLLSGFVFTLVVYIGYKGWRVNSENPLKLSEIPAFNRNQKITMASIAAMVIFCIGFKFDTGLFAFAAASVLILLHCADEKTAIRQIPWGTLMMICGVGVLVNVLTKLGGIKLVSDFLASHMTAQTAVPIIAAPGSAPQRVLSCRHYFQSPTRLPGRLPDRQTMWNSSLPLRRPVLLQPSVRYRRAAPLSCRVIPLPNRQQQRK